MLELSKRSSNGFDFVTRFVVYIKAISTVRFNVIEIKALE